jgi:hypothetical protein
LLEAHRQRDDAIEEAVGLRREAGRHVKISLREAVSAYQDAYLKNLSDGMRSHG